MPPKVGVIFDPSGTPTLDLRQQLGGIADIIWMVRDGRDGGRVPRALLERLGAVVEVASGALDDGAEQLARAGIGGIVSFRDEHIQFAAELAERLGLPYHSVRVAARLANKFLQRQALASAGVHQPRYWHLPDGLDTDQLRRIAASVEYPAIIKPVNGAGSRGVVLVRSLAELEAAYRPETESVIEAYLLDTDDRDRRFACLVAVVSAVSEENITHLAVTGNFELARGFRQSGCFSPAAVDEATRDQLLELATAAIRALGIRHGMVHTEIKLTPTGPQIVEVNGRVSGLAPTILAQVSEVSLTRLAVELALGRDLEFDALIACDGVGYLWDFNRPLDAGGVIDIRGTTELAASELVNRVTVQVHPGGRVDHLDGAYGVVRVVGRAGDHDQLVEAMQLINSTVEIDYQSTNLERRRAVAAEPPS